MHRVSSRPRIVSDADAAFCAAVSYESDENLMDPEEDGATTLCEKNQVAGMQEGVNVAMQDSFDLLEIELMGMFADRATSGAVGSGKRKRLSNYMTPVSSYGNLNSQLIHPLCDVDHTFTPKSEADGTCFCDLPSEAVIHMATYLSPSQIQTLSLATAQLRDTLIHSQGAKESLWMRVLREEFPGVFEKSDGASRDVRMLTSSDVTFVDNTSSTSSVTLALSTALFPKRYPKQIDKITLETDGTRHPFRTFCMKLNGERDKSDGQSAHESNDVIVEVVQFTGTVGTGDRCIRSDQPFPRIECAPSRKIRLNSPWKLKSKSSHCNSFVGSDGASTPLHPSTPRRSSSLVTQSTPSPPQRSAQSTPHSPLLRFLSSISHHTDNSMQDSFQSSEDMESDEDDIGVNSYGVFNFGKCKERLGKIARGCKPKQAENLRPFVVPLILSEEQCGLGMSHCNDGIEKLVVDVTPRLCAYFEVTILKHADAKEGWNVDNVDNVDNLQPPNRLAPRVQHAILPVRHGWRLPHLLPMHPLVDIQGDDLLPPLPMLREHHNHFARGPLSNVDNRSRHECVAIGLSTMAFNPRDKMPGWDSNSYGYHGDDGGLFHGHGDMIRPFGPSFGPGDTVGCGLDYTTRHIFFVKNGEFLGYGFHSLPEAFIERGLYPTVGVDTECPLFVNFGARPFRFDLNKFTREGFQDKDA